MISARGRTATATGARAIVYPPARAGARTRRAAAQRVRRAWSARRAARAVRVRTVRLRDTRAAPATAPNSVA